MDSKTLMAFKIFAILFLVAILFIPTAMISSLIDERAERRVEASQEVGSKWGGRQVLVGPVLTVPYDKKIESIVKTSDGKTNTESSIVRENVYFLPLKLNVDGSTDVSALKRGIYEVSVYNSNLKISGEFDFPDFSSVGIAKDSKIDWDAAYLTLSLSDLRGLQQNLKVNWDGHDYQLDSGFKSEDLRLAMGGSGLNVKVPIRQTDDGKKISFSLELDINGTENLSFVPLGEETLVKLNSNWLYPNFDGAFLPDDRQITEKGFSANWNVFKLNRDYPQVWEGISPILTDSSFGVNFIMSVDEYQKNTRAVKYAIMLISLTFLVFFFIEILGGAKIHFIHYGLVGLSLVLFFSLLVSITEHSDFGLAYLISSLATIILVSVYTKSVFKSNKLVLLHTGILSVVYVFIYTIIQMDDYALLMGNIGLFIVLAIVMMISKNVDWYKVLPKDVDATMDVKK